LVESKGELLREFTEQKRIGVGNKERLGAWKHMAKRRRSCENLNNIQIFNNLPRKDLQLETEIYKIWKLEEPEDI